MLLFWNVIQKSHCFFGIGRFLARGSNRFAVLKVLEVEGFHALRACFIAALFQSSSARGASCSNRT